MKKFLFILCMFSSVANAEILCEDAGGKLFKGNDGKTEYCLSYHGMNWWSANAWCQSLGLELIDLPTECKKRGGLHASPCPQFNKTMGGIGWTKNTASSSRAMSVELHAGTTNTVAKNNTINALCLVK